MRDNSNSGGGSMGFEEFDVKIGLRPLLLISVLDMISRKTVAKDAMKKLLYADDLALVANGKLGLLPVTLLPVTKRVSLTN